MMRACAAAVVALAGLGAVARADNTVPGETAGPAPRCDFRESRYFRDLDRPEVARARARVRDFSFQQRSEHFLLFTSRLSERSRRSVVLDADGQPAAELAAEVAAIVESPDGGLDGLLAIDRERHELLFFERAGRLRWRSPRDERIWTDSATVARDGDRLYVALFHRNATGSMLIAVDARSGARLWTADVEQLMVSHSKYFNDVVVERRGAELILRGTESGGCYLQRFDAATGRRLSSKIFH
jgi:hypothetical protein